MFVLVNHNGGKWLDNSNVFVPKVRSDCDFHGFGTNGVKIYNVVTNEPILLFELQQEKGLVELSRLFHNQKDPKSNGQGMDFSNSIIDHNGEELYAVNYEKSQRFCLFRN